MAARSWTILAAASLAASCAEAPSAAPADQAGEAEDTSRRAEVGPEETTAADTAIDVGGKADGALSCPGGAHCPCSEDSGCDSGLCLDTPAGKLCAGACESGCPDGFSCAKVNSKSGDILNVCVPKHGFLCEPCVATKQCEAALGVSGPACVDYGGSNGSFCGAACQGDAGCPPGYSCGPATTIEGAPTQQCRRKPESDGSIACPCDKRAIALALSSPCKVKAELGTCAGFRQCKADGLAACSAPKASDEICDGVDNDCDGGTDEGLCSDGNPCTDDACDGNTKGCVHSDNKAPCDDKSACTDKDVCSSGKCAGAIIDCNDKNACTSDSCDAAKGCTHAPIAGACDDFDACTTSDACKNGVCAAGAPKDCGDGNPCTVDLCSAATGCTHGPQPGPCDDGNPCTNGDACGSGSCQPGTNVCNCTVDKDCIGNEDGNLCNGTLYCDKTKAPYVCAVDPKTLVTCDTSKDTVCQFTVCEPLTGVCGPKGAIAGKLCNADDSVCTKDDACKAGQCTPGAAVSCDDGNPCTDDLCDPKSGCKNAANIQPCDDGNNCTTGDTCTSSQCVSGKKVTCDDKSECTVDVCDVKTGLCKFDGTALAGSPCDADGSVCTVGDACAAGKCAPGAPKVCDDSNVCTTDDCDKTAGCLKLNNAAGCDFDGNPCTVGDLCKNGACTAGTKKDCDDKNACTIDQCVPSDGSCKHIPDPLEGTNCEDGDQCTTKDLCKAGKCLAGPPASCDDADTCTLDGCNPLSGCTHQTLADASPCNDGNVCTSKDLCVAGKCGGIKLNCDDGTICTDDACTGTGCSHSAVADTKDCGAGKWCVAGACKTKGCGDGFTDKAAGEQCDDGNAAPCDGCEACQARGTFTFDGNSYAIANVKAGELLGSLALEGDLTVEAWVRPDALTISQTIVAKGLFPNPTAFTAWGLGLAKASGAPTFVHLGPDGGELVTGTGGVKAGVWSHVAVVVAGEKVRFFVNGVAAGGGTLTKQRRDGTGAPVVLGRRFADVEGEPFAGGIDAVRLSAAPLYGGPFTPSRRPTATADTRALWLADEPAPPPSAPTATDSGPFGHTLALKTSKQIAADGCYGASAAVAVCGDGGSAPAFEACDDGNTASCDGCEGCQFQRALQANGTTAVATQAVALWATDAFCPTCEVTVEAWARLDKNNQFNEIVGLSCGAFSLMVNGGKFALARYGDPLLFGPPAELGKWYHVAGVVNWSKAGAYRLYVDGQPYLPASAAGAAVSFDPTHVQEILYVGAGGGGSGCASKGDTVKPGYPWTGLVDEVRVSAGMRYTDAFVPPRRAWPDRATRALWRFDTPPGATVVSDDSGNAVPTTVTALGGAADQCLGQGGASQCGDGQKAKFEWCDNGASNGPPPKLCSGVCLNAQTPDCSALTVTGAAVVKANQIMNYYPYWTVDGWVRLASLPAAAPAFIVGVAGNAPCPVMPAKQDWYVAVGPGGVDASQLGGANQTSSKAVAVWKTGVWQHFALQYDGLGKGSLWVDGVRVRTFSAVASAWSTTCPLLLGNSGGGGIAGQAASLAALRLSKKVRYGQQFTPPWQLAVDADTAWRFQFDDGASGLNQTQDAAAIYKITWTSGASFEADGPKCK